MWVGFIALFGTAVQTGVVMVIYLEEAVARKGATSDSAARLTRTELREAVMEGALLAAASEGDDRLHGRRRPAADHVEHARRRRGDEAAGDAGLRRHGSSLLHVLIVTPVIFLWLRERELKQT